ncbi:MAG: NupC/NupG family nucleoside CNT transporter [Myxococcaceae bacterium]|nr:NupC/NupG family nucleoside CNT transporter [Myxococcaceae bacterium]MBH2006587.1 NupC/NupG family nucleoside CNT transporter [Myxococcaceae bacterium]
MKIGFILLGLLSSFLPAEGRMLAQLQEGVVEQSLAGRLTGLLGCVAMILFAVLLSSNRRAISWRLVSFGIFLQFSFAFLVLKMRWGKDFFEAANNGVLKILSFSNEGAQFVFGNLVHNDIAIDGLPEGTRAMVHVGGMFAFSVLPTIVFFSALTAVLYHIRALEWLVRGMSWAMRRTMRASGAESFSAAVNIFVGQTEAPLLVKPFLANMTRSEIMAVMTGGFANVSGGIMAAYVAILMGYFPDIAGHLLAASIMSAPASLVFAKIMVPETAKPETLDSCGVVVEKQDANVLDAAARGTTDGLSLALSVAAMLISFIALIAFLNWGISATAGYFGFEGFTLQFIFSKLFAPLAWLLGVPWSDAPLVGSLLGTKTVINELVAYLQMASDIEHSSFGHAKSVVIATYALCGFANFSSIGIQVGGLATMAPNRRTDFAKLGLRAMIAGSLTSFQTAAMAGMLL